MSGPPALRLGRFDLVEEVGVGGMGTVWRATFGGEHSSPLDVAVKILSPRFGFEDLFASSFHNEVRSVARLDHPHVVRVFDHGDVPADVAQRSAGQLQVGAPWFAMEYLSGGSLEDELGMVRWPRLRRLLLELLEALAHAHARDVVHRDLKPANVLRDAAGGIKLTDFGLAHARVGQVHEVEGLLGTPAYMAPEQFDGDWRDIGPWSDLYGLGCLGYALTVGEPPFGVRGSAASFHYWHSSVDPDPLPLASLVPEGFEAWLLGLLEKDPLRRCQRAADAAHALRALPEDGPEPLPFAAPPAARLTGPIGLPEPPPETDTQPLGLPPARAPLVRRAPRGEAFEWPLPPLPSSWRERTRAVLAPALTSAGMGLFGLRPAPLVGREDEKNLMWSVLRDTHLHGRSRGIILRGGGGVGAGALAQWLCQRADEVGAVMVLRATHAHSSSSGDAFVRMVRRTLRLQGLGDEEAAERIRGYASRWGGRNAPSTQALIQHVLGGRTAPADELAAHAMSRSDPVRVYTQVLEQICTSRPVLLWIEEAQWAAEALEVVQAAIQREGDDLPLLAVMTVDEVALARRPMERARLDELARSEQVVDRTVGPLAAEEMLQLLRSLLDVEDELAAGLIERSRGNPRFAVALLGELIRKGALEEGPQGFRRRRGVRLGLPASELQVWSQRLEEVLGARPRAEGHALELAAVLGPEANGELWAAACSRAKLPAGWGMVEELLRLGMASLDGPDLVRDWRLAHQQLREALALRAEMGGRLADHHRVAAEVLAEEGGPVQHERLGRHRIAAGDLEGALEPLLAGARHRHQVGDTAIGLRLLRKREDLLEQLGVPESSPRWGEGWRWMIPSLRRLRRVDDAFELARRMVDSARAHPWPDLLFPALLELASSYGARGEVAQESEAAHEALAVALEHEDAFQEAQARRVLAITDALHGHLDAAWGGLERALEVFEEGEHLEWVALCCLNLGVVAHKRGDQGVARRFQARARDLYMGLDQPVGVAYAEHDLADSTRLQGDLDAAAAGFRRALSRFQLSDPSEECLARLNLGLVELQRGRFAEAREVVEGAQQLMGGRWYTMQASAAHLALMVCSAAEGRWDDWEARLDSWKELHHGAFAADPDLAQLAEQGAQLALAVGRRAEAAEALRIALQQWETLGRQERVELLSRKLRELEERL